MYTHRRNIQKHEGFTLIEIIIYLALFSIVLGGAVLSAFLILESNDTNETRVRIASEANFLLSKIDYLLSGAETINYPSTGLSCTGDVCSVSVVRYGTPRSVVVTASGDSLFVAKDGGVSVQFGGAIPVTEFSVTHNPADSVGRERVIVGIQLQGTTSRGVVISENFDTTYYLK